MKLSKVAILALRGSKDIKTILADELGTSYPSVARWILENDSDGPLTRVTAIKIIQRETGLLDDQILEESEPEQATAERG